MAKPQDIITALDYINKFNNAHDQINCAGHAAQGKNPQDWTKPLQVIDEEKSTPDIPVWRNATFSEKKVFTATRLTGAVNYLNALDAYKVKIGEQALQSALSVFNVSLAEVEVDLQTFANTVSTAITALAAANIDKDIDNVGKAIEAAVPQLQLLRRVYVGD